LMPKTKVHVFDCSVHFIILIYYALLPLLQRSCINDINSQGTLCNTEPREKTRGSSKTKYVITLLLRWGMWWIVFYFSHFSNLTRD
jgi:hypothetical protein